MNTFRVPSSEESIHCGISWLFVDDEKLIDLDLIVTALDVHSFEMDSVNKDHKKMFKKSIVYNKNAKRMNRKDDKLIDISLDSLNRNHANCHSLWFRINAISGDSLKDVDKAMFTIYGDDDDEDDSSAESNGNGADDAVPNAQHKETLYSCDIGMGFDCGAILLGVLYRAPDDPKEWIWTVVEEKNVYSSLILNNLHLFYDEKVIANRPHPKDVKSVLTKCGERYIIHQVAHCTTP